MYDDVKATILAAVPDATFNECPRGTYLEVVLNSQPMARIYGRQTGVLDAFMNECQVTNQADLFATIASLFS